MKDSKIVELEKIVLILYLFNLLRSGKSKEKFLLAKQLFVAVTALQSKLKRAERNFFFEKKRTFFILVWNFWIEPRNSDRVISATRYKNPHAVIHFSLLSLFLWSSVPDFFRPNVTFMSVHTSFEIYVILQVLEIVILKCFPRLGHKLVRLIWRYWLPKSGKTTKQNFKCLYKTNIPF